MWIAGSAVAAAIAIGLALPKQPTESADQRRERSCASDEKWWQEQVGEFDQLRADLKAGEEAKPRHPAASTEGKALALYVEAKTRRLFGVAVVIGAAAELGVKDQCGPAWTERKTLVDQVTDATMSTAEVSPELTAACPDPAMENDQDDRSPD
jgi:hypothetical protein